MFLVRRDDGALVRGLLRERALARGGGADLVLLLDVGDGGATLATLATEGSRAALMHLK